MKKKRGKLGEILQKIIHKNVLVFFLWVNIMRKDHQKFV